MTPSQSTHTKPHHYFTILFCILFCVFPLYPQLSSTEMAFLFRSSVVLFLGIMIGIHGWQHGKKCVFNNPIILPLTAMTLLCFIGIFYSPDIYNAKAKWAVYGTVFCFFLLIRLCSHEEKMINCLLWGLFGGGLLTALYALYLQFEGNTHAINSLREYTLYDPVMQEEIIKTLEGNRAMGAFGNPNHLAGYLVLTLWVVWYLYQSSQKSFTKYGLILAGLVLSYTVYQSYSRSGLLVLAFSLCLFVSFTLFYKKRVPIKPVLYTLFPVFLVFVVTLYLLKDQLLGGRLFVSSTILARLHFFRGGWLIIQDHPWFGVGTEGFESYYSALLRPGDIEARYVHNIVLEYALQWGIIGLLVLIWLTAATAWFLWKQFPHHPYQAFAAFGSFASLVSFSLVDFHNHLIEMYIIPVFLLAGVGTSYTPVPQKRADKINLVLAYTVLCCFWIGLVLCPFFNGIARERAYAYLLDQQYMRARNNYQWAVYIDSSDHQSWNHLGHVERSIPSAHSPFFVLQYTENAVEWAPRRASYRADYAEALFMNGYPEQAITQMKRAIELFPARPVYSERLAALYEAMGQTENAAVERETAEKLKTKIKEKRL